MLVYSSLSFPHSCASGGVGAVLSLLAGAPAEHLHLWGSYWAVPSRADDLALSQAGSSVDLQALLRSLLGNYFQEMQCELF